MIKKLILKPLAILTIKYLQNKYKKLSVENRYNQTNQVINNLRLIQSILYWFKSAFSPWGYFHPDCTWSVKKEKNFNKLFPIKDFEELSTVINHNPEAITYYHNKIYGLNKGISISYEKEIEKQLRKWNCWR